MKNLFELLADIHNYKPEYKITTADEFSPFMICKWISMVNPLYCALINEAYNTQHKAFEDSQMIYDYMKTIMPKKSMAVPKYIKKSEAAKRKSEKEAVFLERMAESMQISKKEVKELLELFPDAIKEMKEDDVKIYKKKG